MSLRTIVRAAPGARTAVSFLRTMRARIVLLAGETVYRVSPVNWPIAETALLSLLRRRIVNRMRHDWYQTMDPPHFSYSNYNALAFSYFETMPGPGILLRGFVSSEIVRPGNRVLDIGCGDGFFSKRFLAVEAAHVDALDVDPATLAFAHRYNTDPKVSFHLLDAVHAPFPSDDYDLIVWDGAIGHFSREVTNRMFAKIRAALKPDGVFCGSEQLGRVAAHDHLQYWETLDEVRAMLAPHFRFVAVRAVEYFYDLDRTARRGEFFWRASDSREPLVRAQFDPGGATDAPAGNGRK